MDAMLKELEKQGSCTPASGLLAFLTLFRMALNVAYPNIHKKPIEEEYDFIVVGGGTAGCVVASRLSEDPKIKVLVLEAGEEEPKMTKVPGIADNEALANSSVDWHYWTEPHPKYHGGKKCFLPRAKMLGGCDSHNEMWYLIPNRRLHDEMTKRGIEGWSYEEMLPFYKKRSEAREIREDGSEEDMSIEKFPYADENIYIVQEAYKEMGFPEPSSNGHDNQDYKTTSKHGERVSSNRLYLEKQRFKRPNLQVSTNSFVIKVEVDNLTKTAKGVKMYFFEDGKKKEMFVKARKEVIVCAGVINTPHLLQLSGIGPKEVLVPLKIELIKDLPVGRNFQNHPSFSGTTVTLTSTSTIPRDCDVIRKDIRNYVLNKSGPFAGSGAYISYLVFNSSYATREYPDLMMSLVPSITGLDLPDTGFSMCYYNKMSSRVMTTRVKSKGTIVCKSKDPFEHPAITLGYSKEEFERLVEGVFWAHKIVNSKTFQKYGWRADNKPLSKCKHEEYGSLAYWKCAIDGHMLFWHHGMSSCSMGPKDDPLAVVDSKCKVYGTKGLRIVDASIIPVLPNVNPNALVLAAAERCAHFIKNDYA